ncbi:hypothetical protein I551_4900 [Mycobacterium ulcerans str. Harvey]|uniref:Uncharacterized protein n=1 Tax=Mycobacterium ulcerans str. Harvey TaxID=1299332 RepID=A0ABP3AB80_MYCUL|nr:hypothetical protein I551_4900 [Mycobacterium ulcerans str. Harvey]
MDLSGLNVGMGGIGKKDADLHARTRIPTARAGNSFGWTLRLPP